MHLSSITIKGFKSFPERTRLVFSPGVSVIVGPNGCGKSNITDAVLWALGEQSPLSVRGQTMQDMVFAGGDGTGPSRYAEVEVVLDNDGGEGEFSEIAIQSRLERGGEGGYRINGARARLADVIETLADAQPRSRDALGDQPGQGRGDRALGAARAPPAGRGGRGARQAPQAPAPRPAEARAHPGQPRPCARRRARGAHAGCGRSSARRRPPTSTPGSNARAPSCAPDFWLRTCMPRRRSSPPQRVTRRPHARRESSSTVG